MTHVRYLLDELGVAGDLTFLATAMLAPIVVPVLERELELTDTTVDQAALDRILAGWEDLTDRVVARRRDA